ARSSLSDPALATKALDRCILFCSAQEIQTSSNLKSVPPTVVAHDLSSLCDFKQIKKKKNIYQKDFLIYLSNL
ncbi:Protein of unknown function, partial [Cotesia congregata]